MKVFVPIFVAFVARATSANAEPRPSRQHARHGVGEQAVAGRPLYRPDVITFHTDVFAA